MGRGKRYSHKPKLNIKKVIAVILAIIVIIAFIIAIKKLITKDDIQNITAKTYASLYLNNKWGVIDNKANIVIEPVYDEMIIIPDPEKDIFICTEDVNYENNTYQVKVLNAKGKEILKEYNKVQAIENYDTNNNLWYEKNILRFEKDGKYGLINLEGKIILQAEYDDIYALKGTKDSIITVKENKLGLVNCAGTKVVPNQYTEIKSLGESTNLYIVKNDQNHYGIEGKLEIKYQEIKPLGHKEIYLVKENNQYKVINQSEEQVLPENFDDIIQIKDNIIVYAKNKKCGAYDINQNKKIPCEYEELTYTCNNYFIAKKNNAYGIIDLENQIKEKIEYAEIEYYNDAQVFELVAKNTENSENKILNNNLEQIAKGMINEVNAEKSYIKLWTQDGYKYYNLAGEEKDVRDILKQNQIFLKKENGKYGYVDKAGNVVVDYIYDDAKEQNEYGYAAVKKDGKWGAIDTKGNIVASIEHSLDENLLIDFIGQYYLGKDLNLKYYTKQ